MAAGCPRSPPPRSNKPGSAWTGIGIAGSSRTIINASKVAVALKSDNCKALMA